MPATSPARVLGLILYGPNDPNNSSQVLSNPDIVLLDYRDPATFSALWLQGLESGKWKRKVEGTTQEEPIDLTDFTKQFLIIGNDPPDGIFDTKIPALAGINFRSHFTATSWLAAWKVKSGAASPQTQDGKNQDPRLANADQAEAIAGSQEAERREDVQKLVAAETRIAVIDSRPAGLATGVAQALQSIFSARNATGLPLVPGVTILNDPSLDGICQWLKAVKADSRTLAQSAPHLRELLKATIWNELTSKSEQHHALSNVLGPVILSGKLESDPPELNHVTLLRRLLSACGLVSWEGKKADEKQLQPSEIGRGLQILLLDDQAKQGWEDWVKECFPDAASSLQVEIDPTTLVNAITKALTDDEGNFVHKDARFRLKLPGLEAATHPVLLLDLRLFSGKEEAESEFLKNKLLPLVNHFTDKLDLSWLCFSSQAPLFQRAKTAVETGKLKPDTEEHHEVLTWLPRVVALADMSLPIILFSSTGRRDLVEPFKPYGNIITSFEKPRLNDLAATSVCNAGNNTRDSCVALLRDSVMKGRTWLKAREAANRIKNTHLDALTKARKAFSSKSHFEIYHDESRNVEEGAFRVVSLLVGFDDAKSADRENKEFPIKFCWGNLRRDEYCLEKRAQGRNPEEARKNQIARWSDIILPKVDPQKTPVLFTVAALGEGTLLQGESSSIFDPGGLDNINSDLLMLQWESLLVDVLPSLLSGRNGVNVSISLYGATRFRTVILNSKTPEQAIAEAKGILETFRKEWGIELRSLEEDRYVKDAEDSKVSAREDGILKVHSHPGEVLPFKLLWRSLRSDSFWKVTADVLHGRRESRHYEMISKAVHRALGVTLAYGAVPMDPRGRRLHYLADVLAGLVAIDVTGSTITVSADPFHKPENKALVAFRSRILSILNANRLLDLGNCDSEAFAVFDWLMHTEDKLDIAYLSLAERLMERLPDLQGTDLIRMVSLLETPAEWMDRNRINAPERNLSNSQHQDVKKRELSPLAHKASELDSPSADASSSGQLNELLRRWRIRRYQNAIDYRGSGAQWHNKEGFKIRRSKGGKISVFADLTVLTESSLDSLFKVPVGNSFKSDGTLLGDDWSP